MTSNADYLEIVRELHLTLTGNNLPEELSESLLLRDAGVSSLMAITMVSQHLENRDQDPADIDLEWIELLDTFDGLVQVLRNIDVMANAEV